MNLLYLWSIGKWVHKDIYAAKVFFNRFSNFLKSKAMNKRYNKAN